MANVISMTMKKENINGNATKSCATAHANFRKRRALSDRKTTKSVVSVAKSALDFDALSICCVACEKGLTPAVRGDYAKHNCPLDQYVRLTADATMVGLRMI